MDLAVFLSAWQVHHTGFGSSGCLCKLTYCLQLCFSICFVEDDSLACSQGIWLLCVWVLLCAWQDTKCSGNMLIEIFEWYKLILEPSGSWSGLGLLQGKSARREQRADIFTSSLIFLQMEKGNLNFGERTAIEGRKRSEKWTGFRLIQHRFLLSRVVMFSFYSRDNIGVAGLAKCAFSGGKWEDYTPFGISDCSSTKCSYFIHLYYSQ